jgi:hypothetical protein
VSSEGFAAVLSIDAMVGGYVWLVCGGDGGVLRRSRGTWRALKARREVVHGSQVCETASECVFSWGV